MTADTLHARVLASRLEDREGWSQQGFALPLLLPRVGQFQWTEIAELRQDKALDLLRGIWREIEEEALSEALAGGDLERAVHNSYERKLKRVTEKVEAMRGVAIDTCIALVLSVTGAAVGGLVAGPGGMALGTVGPTAITGGINALKVLGNRPARRWLALDTRIRQGAM